MIRLDRAIVARTEHTRSEATTIVRRGQVSVDGVIVRDPSHHIDPEGQCIAIEGKIIGDANVTLLLHKPKGYVCANHDPLHKTVFDLLPEIFHNRGLSCVGRLDLDTTGMLLLTNDGAMLHRLVSPKSHVAKYYLVTTDTPLCEDDCHAFAEGLKLADGTFCHKATIQSLPDNPYRSLLRLDEGKYHQVKRMLGTRGHAVTALHRCAIGSLILPEQIGVGEHIVMLHKDISQLWKADVFSIIYAEIALLFS